eukprot:CAMPEP_0117447442 /NCGR_PEP_ID=MMETSP0759-20121206/6877_1 /TAXON_ID=63605 /ORGANISM="Percolomonas cosmopolitus, Strain WS" /LENGTH=721 /DNA_ID=CAMNT_0005239777 /DNA_START=32 /DNA_END=2197 /DNA_ORIENTATION=-
MSSSSSPHHITPTSPNNLPRPIGSSIPSRRPLHKPNRKNPSQRQPLSVPVHLMGGMKAHQETTGRMSLEEMKATGGSTIAVESSQKAWRHSKKATTVLKRRESSRFNVPLVEMTQMDHISDEVRDREFERMKRSQRIIDEMDNQSMASKLAGEQNIGDSSGNDMASRALSPQRISSRSISRGRSRPYGAEGNFVDGHSMSPNPPPRLSMGTAGRRSLGNSFNNTTTTTTTSAGERNASPRSPLAGMSSMHGTVSRSHEHILDHTNQMPHLKSTFQRRHSLSPLRNSRYRLETIKDTLHEQQNRLTDRIHRMDREIQDMVARKEKAEDERQQIKEQINDISEQMSRLEQELEHESKINTALRLVNRSQSNSSLNNTSTTAGKEKDNSFSQSQTINFNLQNNLQSSTSFPHRYVLCSYENFREGRVTLFDMVESESVHCRPHEKASAFLLRHPLMTNSFITATNNDIILHDAFRTDDHVEVQTRRFHVNPRSHFNHGCIYGRENILITCGRDDNSPCVRIWDLNSRQCHSVLTQDNESVLDPMMKCCALPARELVATSCRDGMITIWDLESQSVLTSWKKDEPKGLIKSLLFDPDTPLLYTVVESGAAIDCWDIREPHAKPSFTLETTQKQYRFNHLCLDSSRHRLFSGGDAVHRWDLILRKTIATFPDIQAPVKQLDYLPSGELLILEEGCAKLVNSDNGIVNTQYDFDSNVVCAVNQVAVI